MTGTSIAPARADRARSFWLRPAALTAAAAIHVCALLFLTVPRPILPSPDETIEITIAPQMGDSAPEDPPVVTPDSIAQPDTPPDPAPQPEPDPAPTPTPDPVAPPDPTPEAPPDPTPPPPMEVAETPPDPVPPPDPPPDLPPPPPVEVAQTPPDPIPEVVADPPKREAPEAPAIPRRVKPPPQRPVADREKIVEQQQRERARQRRQAARRAAAQSAAASRAGVADGQQQRAMSRETYGAKVRAEILRNRISAPGEGSVGVAFVVGAAGGMTTVSVIRSSGNEALDSAASRMVRAARPGPPPGGFFAGSTTINFVAR